MSVATVRYVDEPRAIAVSLIAAWDRNSMPEPTSAPTFRNMALSIFNGNPEIERVTLVWSGRVYLFLVKHKNGCWFDMDGKQVMQAKGGDL